jgi:hypothetical protein
MHPRSSDWCIFLISESMNRRRILILVAVAALTYVLTTSVFMRGSSAGQKAGNAFKGSSFSNAVSFLAIIALILGAVRIMHFWRGHAMRRFASRWDLRYIGPTAPQQWWWNTSQPKILAAMRRVGQGTYSAKSDLLETALADPPEYGHCHGKHRIGSRNPEMLCCAEEITRV